MKTFVSSATYFAALILSTMVISAPAIAIAGCPIKRPPGRISEQTVLATPMPGSSNLQVYYPGTGIRIEINPALLKGTPDEYGRIEIPVKDIPALVTGRGTQPANDVYVSPEGVVRLIHVPGKD